MRLVARCAVQVRERDRVDTFRPIDFDLRIQRDQRLREIAGIRRDAFLAGAEYRVLTIKPVERRATRAGHAFVAVGIGNIAEIAASRALEHIAAEARHIAQLRARSEFQ